MYRLVSDGWLYVILNLQLFYGMGDEKFFGTKIEARWVLCPIIFMSGIFWKYRLDIHDRIFKKPRKIREYV